MSDIKALISLADKLLSMSANAEAVDTLENYSQAFQEWYTTYQSSLDANSPISSKEELQSLLERHEKVVNFSEEMKQNIPEEIAKLKQKGMGIMAYTDTLPKKISFTKTRKG